MKKSVISALLFIFLVSVMLFTGCDDTANLPSDTVPDTSSKASSDTASDTGEGSNAPSTPAECAHDYGEWIDEVPAECEKEGIKGHYHCDKCDKDFDKDYNVLESLTVPAGEHNYVNGVCIKCEVPKPSEGLRYLSKDNDSSYYVAGIGTCGDTQIVIPSTYNDLPVTGIGVSAFYGKTIVSVIIPDSITSIGDKAFCNCASLTDVTIPDSVTSIGYSAFEGCTSLASITIPESVTSIDYSAFEGCTSFVSVTIPDNVTSIGSGAFKDCTSLASITLPFTGATKDGTSNVHFGYIFGASSCYDNSKCVPASLKTVVITGGTSIGERAFNGCRSLTGITIPESVTSIGNYAFCCCTSLEDITIPESVTSIGEYAFDECASFVNVTIPDGVTSISGGAFSRCTSLASITIPSSVKSIGHSVFYGCTSLVGIKIPDGVTSIGEWAFYGCTSLAGIKIPDGVTSIVEQAFSGCTSLTSITIPESVTSIGEQAFSGCTSLTSITIPESVTSIGKQAFYGCTSLAGIKIPNSVTSIGISAFKDCTSLTSITIPDSVTSIGSYAFSGCTSLASITLPFVGATKDGTSNTYFGYIFGANSYSNNSKYVPVSLKTVVITGGTGIGDYAFYGCLSLTSITVPNSVTGIGNSVFSGCTGLTSVTIPDSITSIGEYAFSGCTSLTGIKIPRSVTSIGNRAFSKCTSLTSVTVDNGVISIGEYAFLDCTSLTGIKIPQSVTSIGKGAFCNCSSLASITLPFVGKTQDETEYTYFGYIFGGDYGAYYASKYVPKSLKTVVITGGTSIKSEAFGYCYSLTSITIPDSVTSIGNRAFYDCPHLTSITIPDSVTSIGGNAFDHCYKLVEVINKSSLNIEVGSTNYGYIGYYAKEVHNGTSKIDDKDGYWFYTDSNNVNYLLGYSESDTSLTLPADYNGGKYEIYQYAFYCYSLTSITVPDSVTSIGSGAFSGCSGLTSITIPFVGATKDGTSNVHFGYIFGANSYESNFDDVPKSLKTVVITGGTSIGDYAFRGCSSLMSITVPNSVTSIGGNAFSNCTSLMSITVPNSVTNIGEYAFKYCTELTSVTIGNSVTSIGYDAFYECYKLVEVINKSSLNIEAGSKDYGYIGYYAKEVHNGESKIDNKGGYWFYTDSNNVNYLLGYSGSDTSLTLPADYNGENYEIYKYAFYRCSTLKSITVPDSVTSIGYNAFRGCTSLTSVTFKNTSGWYVSTSSTATSGTAVDVTDASQNATYLKSTYDDYYWKRGL